MLIVRVRNAHTARIDDLAPGAEGEVDASKKGVKHLLDAGLLVPCEGGSLEASVGAPGDESGLPPRLASADAATLRRELVDCVAFLRRVEARRDELDARASQQATALEAMELELRRGEDRAKDLSAKVAELDALPKNVKDLRDQLIAARAEIATLKAPAGGG